MARRRCLGDDGIHVWRNKGSIGFEESRMPSDWLPFRGKRILDLVAADFDGDCDLDWVVEVAGEGLKFATTGPMPMEC